MICDYVNNFRIKRKEKPYEEMASLLQVKIKISEDDINSQYQDFMSCYPEGKISEEEFLEIFSNNTAFNPKSLFRSVISIYINALTSNFWKF